MKKVYVKTFGCQMNEYDSDKMVDVLGLETAQTPEDADIILLNTCSVREKAQEKVFSDLGRLRAIKANRPDVLIGVGGCVASQEGDNIVQRAPYVDLVFGPQTLHRLPDLIAKREQSGKAQVDISFPEIEKFDHIPPAKVEGGSAYVSIMEGCSKYCSFCVVPYTRGEEVSRPFDDIIFEVAGLLEQGVKEIVLLGQNVNAYRGSVGDGEIADFAFLLECIHEMDGLERLRYTTSHPREMTERLIECYRHLPKLVGHLHLPVQSGSDRVLSAMKRGYTSLEYKSIIRKIRAVRPDISISSDFIVGFPGETEEEFLQTIKLAHDVGFDTSYIFVYSARPGTPASNLPDETTQDEKLMRLQRLQEVIDGYAQKISQNMIGTVQRVLVEGISKTNSERFSGRTENNRLVHFEGHSRFIHQMIDVEVTEALAYSLLGNVCVS